jgi:Lanthionine synthetase C-like protein
VQTESVRAFEAERHTSLLEVQWDQSVVRAEIQSIVNDAYSAYSPGKLWPVHTNDSPNAAQPFYMLYIGAAGVVWALDHLARVGASDRQRTFDAVLVDLIEPNRAIMSRHGTGSLLMGDTGILFTHWRSSGSNTSKGLLASAIAGNRDNAVLELMWGSPGTMLAALAMHDLTGESRWADLYRESAVALQRACAYQADHACWLWTQDLYGSRVKMIGAVHGFAGNAFALIRGRALLDPDVWTMWSRRIADTLVATALHGEGGVNWPRSVGAPRPGRTAMLLQHCHGAPGMVTCLAGLSEPIDDLLLEAGETVWNAGPLAKGAGLCHGTAGNGYAFLKLFARTGDQLWLERARAFAMHAIAQSTGDLSSHGARRYSLWTGDLGLAIYLWNCLEARADFPTMDLF